MFLSDLSIKRPIMMSMLLIVFMLFGAISFFGMSLNLTPEVDIPYVMVQTAYPGAGPKEIETQITKKIEDAVSSISKMDMIKSYSMEGFSMVQLKFELGKDVDIANQEVKDKIDRILNELPDDAETPIVEKYDMQEFPIVEVILSGNRPITELWEIADKSLKDRFSQIEGVARTDITGGQEREIQVVLDNRAVFQNTINLNQLSQILGAQNMDMPGGHFERNRQEYTVRLTAEYENVDEIASLEIPTAHGPKRIKDIAEVRDSGTEVRERTSFFNNVEKIGSSDVVMLSLVKNSEGNTVEIAADLNRVLPEIESTLPSGTNLNVVTDKSVFIKSTVNDTLTNIILGIILTGLVLLIFLHDIRSTIIVALAMPTSIISAFLLMGMADFTKNIMSLMGLSTAVGVLVSNSVVVLENIFRQKSNGLNRKDAASVGTSEVVVAVVASTATNIAVFLPVASMSSMVGQFFKEFALTVTFATLFSLLISFTLTPMLASLILPENGKKRRPFSDWIESWFKRIENGYRGLLKKLLRTRGRSSLVLLTAVSLLVGTFMLAGNVGFEFMPLMDEGDIRIEVELPTGYNLHETATTLQNMEDRLKKNPEVKQIVTQIGKISEIDQGTNLAVMKVKLVPVSERESSSDLYANRFIRDLSVVPNATIRVRAISSVGGSGRPPIEFYLMGQEVERSEQYKDEILSRIKDVPGIVNLNTSSRSGKPEISILPDRKKISDAGLTIYDIAMQLRGAMTGLVATQYRDAGEEYDIRVMIDDASIDSPEEIANLTVFSQGRSYTMAQLADIEFTGGVSKILHLDKYIAIEFTASPASGVPMGDVMGEITSRLEKMEFESGYKIDWGGESEMMNEAIIDMGGTLLLAIILTYMLLAAILENLKQPLMILGTFPLALIGVIGALLITATSLDIIAMMAIVMLLGIVVNNAILILDYVNVLVRKQGMTVREALIEAGPIKLRPILMSSIAIILGMMPMAMGLGDAGREMRQAMGIVSIGGLIVSTVLTLLVIPAVLNVFSSHKKNRTEE